MARIEFSWEKSEQAPVKVARRATGIRLSDEVLARNAVWFIKLRWAVAAFLLLFQALAIFWGRGLEHVGIAAGGFWPASIAVILGVANIWYALTIRKEGGLFPPAINIWTQIIVDLVCLTFAVHFLGSLGTSAPFLYVLHIVLAGVFLSTEASFLVLALVVVFYGSCLALEYGGIVLPHSVLRAAAPVAGGQDAWNILLQAASLDILFLLVWFMVAQLSQIIRIRENQLIEAEEQTRIAQKEKDRYAVQMTHQLKSPLDAIRSNISLLVNGYCGALPEEAARTLKRIDFRAKGMGELVIDVLKLSRVKLLEDPQSMALVDIGALLKEILAELAAFAEKRNVSIQAELESLEQRCFQEQMQMFFENILTNAISYSYIGGSVRVCCKGRAPQESCVEVIDQGIGIEADKLPHIFDAYFRTKEASEYNQSSSGIGLAIVKQVAQNHGLRLAVESEPKKGTTFSVFFPAQVTVAPASAV
ncbi:MAG: HAMP domain-containing sensor histidine kinase [Chitinivibrionales bacterium]|nr:HAMP domain-containing sensor histidine kinase [Chitinivibrionales bacterium]